MLFLEDILQEEGGFGCGEINELYVEEECQESDGGEEESNEDEDLSDEDEEEFDVNKVSDVKDNYKSDDVVGKGIFCNEDVEQGITSGFNEDEVMNLNSIVQNVGLVDGFEGDVNDIPKGTIKLVDDKNKEGISDDTVNKVIGEKKKEDELIASSLVKDCAEGEVQNDKVKNDGQGMVEGEGGEVGTDLEKGVEYDSNKNKDGEDWYDPNVHQCESDSWNAIRWAVVWCWVTCWFRKLLGCESNMDAKATWFQRTIHFQWDV
ncbi:unnamed protein product [Lactuca virosa]|uniref:Uncharacterized protein n=1 Tax=Lactuca virosa TaxID=75947 RepID=A0AAU9NR94_9ASTR|nr:unnamed protein product [Lactuca virosa]